MMSSRRSQRTSWSQRRRLRPRNDGSMASRQTPKGTAGRNCQGAEERVEQGGGGRRQLGMIASDTQPPNQTK
eukprot:951077-Rhodomonas_salina.1